jgi:hypothetical protein
VYTALVGNLGITVAKLIAAILIGSIVMLSETLHSIYIFKLEMILICCTRNLSIPVDRSSRKMWDWRAVYLDKEYDEYIGKYALDGMLLTLRCYAQT